eukprot:TRINITY_DN11352_c0_g1_i2.p8 TRINITY_DN11352_c0_g1~~TRINITY_DN11352_c0_g1_i2.p8  ORF type:complete len:103 (+),score=4.70 TRINITY_DN11352_c0_g1_i2:1107-1415(+)
MLVSFVQYQHVVLGGVRGFEVCDIEPLKEKEFQAFLIDYMKSNGAPIDDGTANAYVEKIGCNFKYAKKYFEGVSASHGSGKKLDFSGTVWRIQRCLQGTSQG